MAEGRAQEKYANGVREHSRTLKESFLTAQCYHKIQRLHDDKIGLKGIASEVSFRTPRLLTAFVCARTCMPHKAPASHCDCTVSRALCPPRPRALPPHCVHVCMRLGSSQVGCSTAEVQAALWKPAAPSAYTLFKSSEGVRARAAAAGVSFAEVSKLISKLWEEAKRDGTSSPFEVYMRVRASAHVRAGTATARPVRM